MMTEYLLTFVQNFIQFILAAPVNLMIMLCISLVLKLFGWTFKDSLNIMLGYFLVCFIFAMLGYNMPTVIQIFDFIKRVADTLGTAV